MKERINRIISRDTTQQEDVRQEVLVSIYEKIGMWRRDGKLCHWVSIMADRAAITRLRKMALFRERKKEVRFDESDPAAIADFGATDPADRMMRREIRGCIDGVLETLPEELRRTFYMRYLEDLKLIEIAEAMGVGESAIRVRLTNIRDIMRAKCPDWKSM